eukprot:SRR837773.16134.p1 GENE.SRR837773.16134~~SRR837773.16134.p1  ORF type:complete len:179 (-),score=36.60 SRR837773.16134:69-569(-)
MGCGCVKAADVGDPRRAQEKRDAEIARKMQAREDQAARGGGGGSGSTANQATNWGAAGPGRQLGGGGGSPTGEAAGDGALTAEERRQRALEAAEKRQQNVPGVSAQKAAEMREKQLKADYLGKITEHYNRKKMDMPMGLNAANSDQLRKHWEQIRSGDTAAQVLAS